MSNGWTEERRRKQAERIRLHKPWEKSTGPRSDKGKAASSRNALKHGLYGAEAEIIKALLKSNREFLDHYAGLRGIETLKDFLEQTDRKFNKINDHTPRPPINGGTK